MKLIILPPIVALLVGTARPATAETIDSGAHGGSCLVEANRVVKLSVQAAGAIDKLLVVRGAKVKAGDPVAQIDASVERSLYEAARIRGQSDVIVRSKQAELDALSRKLEQQRKLATRGITSQQALADLETELAVAALAVEEAKLEAMLATAEADRLAVGLERRTVRSPVDGVVTAISTNVGEYAEPAQPIMVINENQPLRVELYLPVELFRLVDIGMNGQVSLEAPFAEEPPMPAVVETKDPSIDASSGTFQLGLRMDNPQARIPSGLRCTVRFDVPGIQ